MVKKNNGPLQRQQSRWEERKRKEAAERKDDLTPEERERWRRSCCEGKIRHETGIDASKQASKLYETRGWRVEAYCCPFCGKWHTGRDYERGLYDETVPGHEEGETFRYGR